MHNRYAPRGHFRPWASLSFPEVTFGTRLVYPTLLSANARRAFLHDVRTGALVQTIDVDPGAQGLGLCQVDVNERYAFVCESRALHVLARDSGVEVLRIPHNVSVPQSAEVVSESVPGVPGNPFVEVLPVRPERDSFRPDFLAGALPSPLPFARARIIYVRLNFFPDSTCIQGWPRSRDLGLQRPPPPRPGI